MPAKSTPAKTITKAKVCVSYATNKALNLGAAAFFGKSKINKHEIPALYTKDHTPGAASVDSRTMQVSDDIHYADVPYRHQRRVVDCADTCIEMILLFHEKHCRNASKAEHVQPRLEKFRQNFEMRATPFRGKNLNEMRRYSSGLDVNSLSDVDFSERQHPFTAKTLAYYLHQYGPIAVRVNWLGGHVLLIKGIVNNKVIIHDPWKGPDLVWPFEKFERKWMGDFVYYMDGHSKASALPSIKPEQPKNSPKTPAMKNS